MSILNSFMVYNPLKYTLKCQRGTRKAYFTLVDLLGRAGACHQKRGGVGIFVHVPGHSGVANALHAPTLCVNARVHHRQQMEGDTVMRSDVPCVAAASDRIDMPRTDH